MSDATVVTTTLRDTIQLAATRLADWLTDNTKEVFEEEGVIDVVRGDLEDMILGMTPVTKGGLRALVVRLKGENKADEAIKLVIDGLDHAIDHESLAAPGASVTLAVARQPIEQLAQAGGGNVAILPARGPLADVDIDEPAIRERAIRAGISGERWDVLVQQMTVTFNEGDRILLNGALWSIASKVIDAFRGAPACDNPDDEEEVDFDAIDEAIGTTDDGSAWKGDAATLMGVIKPVMLYRHENLDKAITYGNLKSLLQLQILIDIVNHPTPMPLRVTNPVKPYLKALPGYTPGLPFAHQGVKAIEQHGHTQMQIVRIIGDVVAAKHNSSPAL